MILAEPAFHYVEYYPRRRAAISFVFDDTLQSAVDSYKSEKEVQEFDDRSTELYYQQRESFEKINMVVHRLLSQIVCGLGMIQLFFATSSTVLGFIIMGMFKTWDGLGVWYGIPLMIPSVLSVAVLATRHRATVATLVVSCLIMLGIGAWHVYAVFDDTQFWEDYRKYAENNAIPRSCIALNSECLCSDNAEYLRKGYTVMNCAHFRVGEEIFWALIILTIGGLVFTLCNTILGAAAWCVEGPKGDVEHHDNSRHPPDYALPAGDHYNYNVQ